MLGSFSPLYLGSGNQKQIPDPFIKNVIMALPMENNGDGISVVDESIFQNGLTRSGTPVITDVVKKFGKSSVYFKGNTSGDFYHSPNKDLFNMLGDFTVEFWIMQVTRVAGTIAYAVSHATTGGTWNEPSCGINSAGNISLRVGDLNDRIQGSPVALNRLYHVSYGRKSGVWYLYLDGILQGTYTNTGAWTGYSLTLGSAGWTRDNTNAGKLNGYIDDFRWWKDISIRDGVTNFTPPVAAWQSIAPLTTIFNPIEILSGGSATEAGYSTPLGWGSISAQPFDGYVIERCAGKKDSTFGTWNNTIRIPGPHSVVEFDRFMKLVPPLRIRRGTVIKNLRPFSRSTAGVIFITTGLDGSEIGFVPGAITILEKVP